MEPNAHVARDRSNGNSRDLSCTFFYIQLGSGEPEPNCRSDNPILERVVDRETSILEEANMRFLSRMQELVSLILLLQHPELRASQHTPLMFVSILDQILLFSQGLEM